MKNDRCVINFEKFLSDILSCKGAISQLTKLKIKTIKKEFCILFFRN